MSLLEVKHLQVVYEQHILAVQDVSLQVAAGQIVVLLGANGAGKSTTLKAIAQLIQHDRGRIVHGEILYQGRSIRDANPSDVVKQGLVQVLEGRRCFAQLTVEENLKTGAFLHQPSANQLRQSLSEIYERMPRLAEKRNTIAGLLSGGEQQLLALGRALMTRPKLLLVDEPSMGLAPIMSEDIFGLLKHLAQQHGLSILLAEQNIDLALRYTDYAYLFESGRVVAQDDTRSLYASGQIERSYLAKAV